MDSAERKNKVKDSQEAASSEACQAGQAGGRLHPGTAGSSCWPASPVLQPGRWPVPGGHSPHGRADRRPRNKVKEVK